MPQYPEGEATSRCDGETVAGHAASAAGQDAKEATCCLGGNGRCVSCEVRDGLPTVHGKVQCYYLSPRGGARILVLERRQGDRIRINGTTELIVLEIHFDQVKVAIAPLGDCATELQGQT